MYFKNSGHAKTNVGYKKVTTYISTADDKDKAHSNPKKTLYMNAMARYQHDKLDKSLLGKHRAGEDLRQIYLYKPYTKRGLVTATNMRGHTKADFIKDERRLMKGRRGVKSREFVISPAPSDKISPNDPVSLQRLADYSILLAKVAFNGRFVRTGSYKYRFRDKKTGKKHTWTRYHHKYVYNPKRDIDDRFQYFLTIQTDSFQNSRTHVHLSVLNRNMLNDKSMYGGYYSLTHCYHSVARATTIWNARYPEHTMSGQVTRGRVPTQLQSRILSALESAKKDRKITSRAKLIKFMQSQGIKAKYVSKTKRRHGGWKFHCPGEHSWIKASKLAGLKHKTEFSSKYIASMLSVHRKQMAKIRRKIRFKRAKAEHDRIYPASSPTLPKFNLTVYVNGTPYQGSKTDKIQYLADTGTLFRLQNIQNNKIDAAYSRWLRLKPRRLARHYTKSNPDSEVAAMMPHLSSNPVRKSVPKVSETYQSQCYSTYHFKDARTGRQEFHILDAELHYTDEDKGWFHSIFGGFIKDWRRFHDKFVHSSIRKHWKRLDKSIKGYINRHLGYNHKRLLASVERRFARWPRNSQGHMLVDNKRFSIANANKILKPLSDSDAKPLWLWLTQYRRRYRTNYNRLYQSIYVQAQRLNHIRRYPIPLQPLMTMQDKPYQKASRERDRIEKHYPTMERDLKRQLNHKPTTTMASLFKAEGHQKAQETRQNNQNQQNQESIEQSFKRMKIEHYNHVKQLRARNIRRRRHQQQGPTMS